jgi:hypothetical protein
VQVEGREVLRPLELGKNRSHIALWSLEAGNQILGVQGNYARTDLTSWPVNSLAAWLGRFRLFVGGLRLALKSGLEEDLERLMSEDFRDPLGGRRDFSRAAAHQAQRGEPWRLRGDAWMEAGGEGAGKLRGHLLLQRRARRTFPTVEFAEDTLGPGGLIIRTLY